MQIYILGFGNLGKAFHKLLPNSKIITEKNLEDINNNIIINCTPSLALPKISKYKPKFVINCCKGLFNSKTPTDYFKKNICSIGGYYRAQLFTKNTKIFVSKEIPEDIYKFLKSKLNIIKVNNSSKEVEMSGIIKNVLLLFNEKFCQEAFLDDYINCLKKGSRNQKFSKLFYKDHKNIEHIKKELGLIEGLEISKQILKDKWLDW